MNDKLQELIDDAIVDFRIQLDYMDIYDAIQSDNPGNIAEIADTNVPVYNADIMELASDPEIWGHENELPPAFDGEPTIINIAATAIYEVIEQALYTEWESIKDRASELDAMYKEELEELLEDLEDEITWEKAYIEIALKELE